MRKVMWLLPASLLIACAKDENEDGIPDRLDENMNSVRDADEIDGDDDGLWDFQEEEVGTQPAKADSDDDGYVDGAEVEAGTDPNDADSVIYKGGWPYTMRKDELAPLVEEAQQKVRLGELFPRVKLRDQFRDEVDLYDFARHGKRVIVDTSAEWCEPCNDMAAYLDGHEDAPDMELPLTRQAILNGDVFYVSSMVQDYRQNTADRETIKRWYETYPTPNVPVLLDPNDMIGRPIGSDYLPAFVVLNEDMEVEFGNRNEWYKNWEYVEEQLAADGYTLDGAASE